MSTKKTLFIIGAMPLLILSCIVLTRLFAQKEISNNTSIDPNNPTLQKELATKKDFNEIPKSFTIKSDSNLTVCPTLELDDLIISFEKEIIKESDEKLDFAIEIMKLQNYKKNGGTLWGSEKWMKNLDYYNDLTTTELAEECFSRSIFSHELAIFEDPRFGFERLKMFHNGFQVLFQRDDMWEGILHSYDYLSSKLNLESDLATIIEISGNLQALRTLYTFPEFKEQIAEKEELFLSANLRVLKKFVWYLENYDSKQLGTDGTPGFFGEPCSIAQVALMLTKQVDPQRYTSIESKVKNVRWPEKQNIEDLKGFIKLVLDETEGVSVD